ncbi:MAG: hypothetical protein JRG91_21475 [Deltaproteobacteria bacterium]|nr:hypothetical protein [Deltaproteobacteria bacterium]
MKVGYACAYTPLPLINAAGFTPYRVLPVGDAEDQAGRASSTAPCRTTCPSLPAWCS